MCRSFFSIIVLFVACLSLISCDDGANDVSKGEAIPVMLEAKVPDEAKVGPGQVRLARIPTTNSSTKKRQLKWKITPGDDDLELTIGLLGSAGHGSSSMSGTSLGKALSSGLEITFNETTILGKSISSMVGSLGGQEAKKQLLANVPEFENSEMKWYELQLDSKTEDGESSTTTSGAVPGSAKQLVGGVFHQFEMDKVNHFRVGQTFLLALSIAVPDGSSFSSGSASDPLVVVIDGESIPIADYQDSAWALWARVTAKE